MSGFTKTALALLFTLAVVGVSAPAAWAAEARLLTQADIDGMGGPTFQGGVGDYLLKNNAIEAVVLAVGRTPDGVDTTDTGLGSYFTNGLAPTGGILIDLMTTGDANDQLQTIAHNVNLLTETGGSILYRGPEAGYSAPVLISGPTASITVTGVVFFPASLAQGLGPPGGISNVDSPMIQATTIYSLSGIQSWIKVTTTITNNSGAAQNIFTLGDENRSVRKQLTFQPFPFRGEYAPPLVGGPTPGIGIMPWFAFLGLLDDSLAPLDAVDPICYAFVAPSLATPFVGFEADLRRIVATRRYDTTVSSGTLMLADGDSMIYERRIAVAPAGGSPILRHAEGGPGAIEDCADVVNPLLYEPDNGGADLRAVFQGRVVTPTGDPIPGATIFVDNTSPGFQVDAELNALSTVIELGFDGQADGPAFAAAGSAVPATHTRTDADGVFTLRLQAVAALPTPTIYGGTIFAANRLPVAMPPLTVNEPSINTGVALGDFVMSGTGTLEATVTDGTLVPQPTPAKICISGTGVTDDPDFGDQFIARSRFDGLEQSAGDGGAPLDRGNSRRLSEAKRGFPAVNCDAAHDGAFSLELAPGTYTIRASRGPEYSFDSDSFTITQFDTTSVSMSIERLVSTPGWSSVDSHVHSASSNDSGVPLTDRVVSMLAAGVDNIISTDHDQIADFNPAIQSLGMENEINGVTGVEVSSEAAVPVSAFTDSADAYPQSIGHIIGFPVSAIEGNRRRGTPADEELVAATVFDRLRGMDSLAALGATPDTATQAEWLAAIQAGQPGTPGAALPPDEEVIIYAHPRGTGSLGPFNNFGGVGVGYDPTMDVTTAPNDLADLRSSYHSDYVGPDGTLTRGLDFDAFEMLNSTSVDWYLLTRADWFSLLDQGIHKAAVAGSDTHLPVIDGAGYPRFYVPCDPCTDGDLVDSVRGLEVVGTTGPFIRFNVVGVGESAADPLVSRVGSTITALGPVAQLRIEVSAAPWIPVEEVRIYRNGSLYSAIDIPAVFYPVVRYDATIEVPESPGFDAYFVVEAGSKIDATGTPINPGFLENMRRVTTPDMVSLAFTNPIFVDRNGDGYEPPDPGGIFADGFESGDILTWSNSVP